MKTEFPLETVLSLMTGYYVFNNNQRVHVEGMTDNILGENTNNVSTEERFNMCKSEVIKRYPFLNLSNYRIKSCNDTLILIEQRRILEDVQKKLKTDTLEIETDVQFPHYETRKVRTNGNI